MPATPPVPFRFSRSAALPLALMLPLPLLAQVASGAPVPPAPSAEALADCARIGPPADRLTCYDKAMGRAPAPESPGDGQATRPATTPLAGKDAPVAVGKDPDGDRSYLSKYWELDADDKRGIFNFTGYRPNYVLPLHYTTHINRSPSSPTQAAVQQPNYRRLEAKFQLSLRTKVAQDVGLPGGDLWLAFTQQVLWQIWNGEDSKPFRNSDYEPEMVYVVPTSPGLRGILPLGWTWRYTQLGLAHQSNGQSDPLSRSWNRVYLGAGFERGDWQFVTRIAHRLRERIETDNNPDLVSYRGRADFQISRTAGLSTTSLLYRTTLKNGHGAYQLEWSYPLFRNQPNGLRWFVQVYSGFGETLTDYNVRQNSVGAGVTFLQF